VTAFLRRCAPGALLLARLAMGVTWIWAGSVKVREPILFAQTVRAYDLLPLALVHPYAIVVPWVELAAGAGLIAGFWTRSCALLSLLLLASFEAAVGVNLYRGAAFSCGCFSLDGTGGTLQDALARNILLLCASLTLLLARDAPFSLDRRRERASG
jgi:uncharacterized membrane protein YphA (DoxX/SURF4 family)